MAQTRNRKVVNTTVDPDLYMEYRVKLLREGKSLASQFERFMKTELNLD